jgi:hypothetical protein
VQETLSQAGKAVTMGLNFTSEFLRRALPVAQAVGQQVLPLVRAAAPLVQAVLEQVLSCTLCTSSTVHPEPNDLLLSDPSLITATPAFKWHSLHAIFSACAYYVACGSSRRVMQTIPLLLLAEESLGLGRLFPRRLQFKRFKNFKTFQ